MLRGKAFAIVLIAESLIGLGLIVYIGLRIGI